MSDTDEATASVSPLLDSREVASYLKVSESTLSRWRSAETGPPFIKLGGIARYRLEAINEWLQNLEPHHGSPS
jgi:predicted DNA-binding transcriptional regulator AlpA